jgi:nucleoside-triphosphatase
MKGRVLLLTGVPGVGKTTVLRRLKGRLTGRRIRGFLTDEIRSQRGNRLGFQLETLDGRTARLAAVGLRSPHRVGR